MTLAGRAGRARILLCASTLLLGVAGHVRAEGSNPEEFDRKQSTQWFKALEPGEDLRVVNPFGNVYARFGGYEGEVEILATSQRLEVERPELEVRFSRGDDLFRVTVGFVGGEDEGPETRDRVDLVVFVPRGAALDVETRDGLIEAKGLKSDLTAATTKGDVTIRSIEGRARAKTVRGNIMATLENGVTEETQEFVTVTGDVEVWLWEDAGANVTLATSGEISTDFSLQIEHHRFEEPSKHAVAVVGPGGPELNLRSKRGRIRLLRLLKHYKPEE